MRVRCDGEPACDGLSFVAAGLVNGGPHADLQPGDRVPVVVALHDPTTAQLGHHPGLDSGPYLVFLVLLAVLVPILLPVAWYLRRMSRRWWECPPGNLSIEGPRTLSEGPTRF